MQNLVYAEFLSEIREHLSLLCTVQLLYKRLKCCECSDGLN